MFPVLTEVPQQRALDDCNQLFAQSNESLFRLIGDIKNQWRFFWDADLSVEQMQARLDLLANTPVVDNGVSTNALDAYFRKAVRWIANAQVERPDAFAEARVDRTGNYQEYTGPGWIGAFDQGTGRYMVTGPCEWID